MHWDRNNPPVTEQAIEEWRLNPVTQVVHQYCRDWAARVREFWADCLEADLPDLQSLRQELALKRRLALDFANLGIPELEEFYVIEEEESDDGNDNQTT